MTDPTELELDDVSSTVRAGVSIGGRPISTEIDGRLIRVVVDNDLNLPGMFELTFLDFDGSTLKLAGITLGTVVTVAGGTATTGASPLSSSGRTVALIVGEVTAIEGLLEGQRRLTVIRGYTTAHRLQRARRSRTFLNVTDSDIAAQIAAQAKLTTGTIDPTTAIHPYLPQVNQTDWEFLKSRAEEIGYETGVDNGLFYFRKVVGSTVSSMLHGTPPMVQLSFPDNLISFRPRTSAGNLTPDVEVRVWDPMQSQAFSAPMAMTAGGTINPATLGAQFAEGGRPGMPAMPGGHGGSGGDSLPDEVLRVTEDAARLEQQAQGILPKQATNFMQPLGQEVKSVEQMFGVMGNLGPPPSPTAHVVNDRPLATGQDIATGGQAAAAALGTDLGGTFAEAEGDAFGNPGIQPGAMLSIEGAQYPFSGQWLVSRARHVFDDTEHGYRTTFFAHGRQDRSMLGLATGAGSGRRYRAAINGLVCGVVSNVLDPAGRARVKVTLPWLSPDFETDWAPVAQTCAGPRTGMLYLPEVGDEVVLGFEYGDPRRAYVIGSLVNNLTAWGLATAGPVAALESLAGGLGGIGGQIASAASSLESVAADVASLTAMGQMMQATGTGPPMMNQGSGLNLAGDSMNLAENAFNISTPGQLSQQAGGSPLGGGSGQLPGMSGLGSLGSALTGMGLGAVQQSPGMVGEVIRRGYVSNTGNVLVFDDQPMMAAGVPIGMPGGSGIPGMPGSGDGSSGGTGSPGGSGSAGGAGAGGGTGGAGAGKGGGGLGGGGKGGGPMGRAAGGGIGGGALASSITLGNQAGTHGIYIDQVASMVLLQSNASPGVSMSEMPMLLITTGPGGSVIINGGTVTIAAEQALTLMAPEVMVAGETITVAGELIPLTPG